MSSFPKDEVDLDTPRKLYKRWGSGEFVSHYHVSEIEKRLEINFQDPLQDVMSVSWEKFFNTICQPPVTQIKGDLAICFIGKGAVLIATQEKLVINMDPEVSIEQALDPLIHLITANGIQIEWASFMKKDTSTPLDGTRQGVALEYSALKMAFPSGKLYLFGPIDRDHYFYFIYDGVRDNVDARDVQINVIMHQLGELKTTCIEDRIKEVATSIGGSQVEVKGFGTLSCVLNGNTYELIRVSGGSWGTVVSFETNNTNPTVYTKRVENLIRTFNPDRFSVLELFDPQSIPIQQHHQFLAQTRFPEYSSHNKTRSDFQKGYVVLKANFGKDEDTHVTDTSEMSDG